MIMKRFCIKECIRFILILSVCGFTMSCSGDKSAEMQEEIANILAKAITYMLNAQDKEALKYLIDQYKIIIKDLSNNNHEDRQAIIKIIM